MGELGKENSFWSVIGKVAAAVTALGSVVAIYTWWIAPNAELQATIARGQVHVPPHYAEFEDLVRNTLSADNLAKKIEPIIATDSHAPDEAVQRSSAPYFDLSTAFFDQLKLRPFASTSSYESYWDAKVVNVGSMTVSDAALRLPGVSLAVVTREDGTKTIDEKGPVVELGTLGVGEKISVVAWTKSSYIDSRDKPQIYHASGPGTINLEYEPKFRDWFMLHFNVIWASLVILMFALLTLSVVQSRRAQGKSKRGVELS